MQPMQQTVLAGAIEFSPAEIALILAALAALFVVVTAPGWLVLAMAAGRRVRSGRRWPARVAGAVAGLVLSGIVTSLTGVVLAPVADEVILPVAVVASWVACLVLARWLARSRDVRPGSATGAPQGWGR